MQLLRLPLISFRWLKQKCQHKKNATVDDAKAVIASLYRLNRKIVKSAESDEALLDNLMFVSDVYQFNRVATAVQSEGSPALKGAFSQFQKNFVLEKR